jgi:hypothetical protein
LKSSTNRKVQQIEKFNKQKSSTSRKVQQAEKFNKQKSLTKYFQLAIMEKTICMGSDYSNPLFRGVQEKKACKQSVPGTTATPPVTEHHLSSYKQI